MSAQNTPTTPKEFAQWTQAADRDDPLAEFRQHFFVPTDKHGQEQTYLCGNSLGLQPRSVPDYVQQELLDWQNLGVEGHFHAKRPWMPYHELLTEQMAAVVGAKNDEVVCMNSLSVNLHLMMVSFYRPSKTRYKIIIEHGAFPSDHYAVESQIRHHGLDPNDALITVKPSGENDYLTDDDINTVLDVHGASTALVMLPGVQYYTGQVFDIAKITQAARKAGCAVGWDLAHSVGNVALNLHAAAPDFAVWCNYKYMNAGPGAIGGCFVHERHHHDADLSRFAGWWGQDKATRFLMGLEFKAIPTAEGWQLSNPPILAMVPLLASLAEFNQAGMPALTQKAATMTQALIDYLQANFKQQIDIITPLSASARGGQLSLRMLQDGRDVQRALMAAQVICDWREPDCIRIAAAPLYNSYNDLLKFVSVLHAMLDPKSVSS